MSDQVDELDRETTEILTSTISLASAAELSSKSHGALKWFCERDRIPGAVKVMVNGRENWRVPKDFSDEMIENLQKRGQARLSERQKNNIARAYLAHQNGGPGGKSGGELAKQYGIDVSYPRKLVLRGYPREHK